MLVNTPASSAESSCGSSSWESEARSSTRDMSRLGACASEKSSSTTAYSDNLSDEPEEGSTDGCRAESSSSGRDDTSSDSDSGCSGSAAIAERAPLLPTGASERGTAIRSASARVVTPRTPAPALRRARTVVGNRGPVKRSLPNLAISRSLADVASVVSPPAARVPHSLFGRMAPSVPEDFLGRSIDTWSILQHLSARRAVVVCGAVGQDHGVGKSVVLDAAHRAFLSQLGGICVKVHCASLSDVVAAAGARGWIDKIKESVQLSLRESTQGAPMRRNSTGARRRTPRTTARNVTHGFHALSDPVAFGPALEELVADMNSLAELSQQQCRERPGLGGRNLLILDECDHLIQQAHFQDAIAEVLHRCPSYHVLLSTHQRMVGTAGGRFKVVHHALEGLASRDAARLFLRRVQRPLRWGDFTSEELAAEPGPSDAPDPNSSICMTKENENQVLQLVISNKLVAACRGNPRQLIELASRVGPSLPCFTDLEPQLSSPPEAVMLPALSV